MSVTVHCDHCKQVIVEVAYQLRALDATRVDTSPTIGTNAHLHWDCVPLFWRDDEAGKPPVATSPIVYLLWSNKHSMWWRPDAQGYTADIAEAGRFDHTAADRYVVQSANHGMLSAVTCMVAAPDNWRTTP